MTRVIKFGDHTAESTFRMDSLVGESVRACLRQGATAALITAIQPADSDTWELKIESVGGQESDGL